MINRIKAFRVNFLAAVLTLLVSIASGQTYKDIGGTGQIMNGLMARRYFHLPNDTVLTDAKNSDVDSCYQLAKKGNIIYTYNCDSAKWIPLSTGVPGSFIKNDTTNYQNAGFSILLPSRISYLTDVTGLRYGALEVYRTIANSIYKAPQNIRSVMRVYATEAGHEDKEFTGTYAGLHVDALNTQQLTNNTEGLIASAATVSNFGNGNVALMSAFAAAGGHSSTCTGITDRFIFFRGTGYNTHSNAGKLNSIVGVGFAKLTPGAVANINFLTGIGNIDGAVTTQLIGNIPWPGGNWHMYDGSGYKSYFSGKLHIGDTSEIGIDYLLRVAGKSKLVDTAYITKIVGGVLNTDNITFRNYSSSLSPVRIDSNGIALGTTTGIAGTLLNINKVYASPATNVVGIRVVPQVYETLATHTTGLIGATFQPIVTGANNKSWTTSAIQGISVAPTINSGATGTISNVYGMTLTRTFNAAGVTIDTLVYRRTYKSAESTPSVVSNEIYDLVGVSNGIGGHWSRYDATGYNSYWGTGNQLINTNTDNGLGKLQISGNLYGSGSARFDGNILQVSSSANAANYTSLETSTVDAVLKANNSTTGIRRPLTFDALKYTFFDNANSFNPLVIDNKVVAIDSLVTRTAIGYTFGNVPPIQDSAKLFVNGDIIAKARQHIASTTDLAIIGRNSGTGRQERSMITQQDAPAGATGMEVNIGNVPAAVRSSYAKLTEGDSVVIGGGYHGFGAYDVVQSSDASLGAYAAIDSRSQLVGSTGFNHYVGVQSRPVFAGSGNISNYWYSLEALGVHNGSGTVTKYAGLQVDNIQGSGPVTNNYGVYIQSQTRGGTSNWNIYSETGQHYLGGDLRINGTGKTATLTVNGGYAGRTVTVTGTSYSPSDIDWAIVCTNTGTVTVTLPDATTASGRVYLIKKGNNSANPVNINTTSSQNIDATTSAAISAAWGYLTVVSNGTQWYILDN